ncbi:MAG: Rv1355c family protein [Acidobacteriota bacterium]|nr:Rv1355c family protein [Acidobacteriota bacterium]
MSNTVGRRYRYGSGFLDQGSGVRFEGHHPLERPDLWEIYLNEAEGKYRSHGFEGTLRRRELEDGHGVSLFFLGFNPDNQAVAGVRFHGPLEGHYDTALVEELASSPEIGDLRELIDREVRLGAIEVKGAWSKGAATPGIRLVATLSRSVHHAMAWLGSEFAIAAISHVLMPIGEPTGARQVGSAWVPFPDERFKTIAVEWRRARVSELVSPRHQRSLREESEQLSRGPRRAGAGPIDSASPRTRSFRPLLLDVGARAHREVLRVLREDSSLHLIDRLGEQRDQLEHTIPPPQPALLEEGSRWVYYPWRRSAVRLLAPRPFTALRLDRNRNKLTRSEQARLRTLRVGVVGLSAGHTIAHVLAMEGLVGEIRLADFDTLELSNLNRVPASVLDLGVNKAVVAARRIAEIDPYLRVVVVPEGVNKENLAQFLDGLDVVIEECDSLDMKFLVREAARERMIPVVMETSDRGVLDVERFDLEPDRPIFHGLLGELDSDQLAGLSLAEKAPYVVRLIGPRDASSRGAASLLEVGQTVTGWPQLGSEITLGAATVAAAVRRIGLSADLPSGRVRFDVEEILSGLGPVEIDLEAEVDLFTPPPTDPPIISDDPVELIVDAARRAPSGGNVQPWRFEADEDEVRFFVVADRTSAMDVGHRGSFVGLGAALFNARVAASTIQRLGPVKLFPDGELSHHAATMQLGTTSDVTVTDLARVIHSRSANRRMGSPAAIGHDVVSAMSREVEREGARLRVVTDRARIAECAEILAASDRLRFLIPEIHEQMLAELKWPGRDSLEEGLDIRTLEMDASGYAAMELVGRRDVMEHLADWRAGGVLGLRTKAAIMTSSALAVVTVPRADPTWYVRGGAAMERFWLSAELNGLAVQPAAPMFIYAVDERELVNLTGERYLDEAHALSQRFNNFWALGDGEAAVMLLRVFHAPPPSVHSIRLPLADVLSRDESAAPTITPLSAQNN